MPSKVELTSDVDANTSAILTVPTLVSTNFFLTNDTGLGSVGTSGSSVSLISLSGFLLNINLTTTFPLALTVSVISVITNSSNSRPSRTPSRIISSPLATRRILPFSIYLNPPSGLITSTYGGISPPVSGSAPS